MTTIKDYGYDSRQALITSTFDLTTKTGRRDAYRFWIAKGHSEAAATNASGYHPLDEFDSFFGRLVLWIVVGVVGILLFVLANNSYAITTGRADLKDAQQIEEAFVRCLNGEAITLSDGTRWMCMRLMEVRK